MNITFFFCSHQISASRDSLHLAYDFHYYWQGQNYHHIYKGLMAGIYSRGRIFEKSSLEVVEMLSKLPENQFNITVYDTGTLQGWLMALINRVSAPSLMMNGQKYIGVSACFACVQKISLINGGN